MSNATKKPAPQIRYARNNKQIAAALGLATSRKSLARIGGWQSEFEDFPVKSAKGWMVSELRAWAIKHAHEFAAQKALADALSPHGKVTNQSLKLLHSAGGAVSPIADDQSPNEPPEFIDGLTTLAAFLSRHFNMSITKNGIQEWRKKDPPFPAATSANRYHVASCIAWVEGWRRRQGYGQPETDDLFAKLQTERGRGELAQLEHEQFLRDIDRGLYIKRDLARRTVIGALRKAREFFLGRNERELPLAAKLKLESLGVDSRPVAEFYEWIVAEQRRATDAVELKCEEIGKAESGNLK